MKNANWYYGLLVLLGLICPATGNAQLDAMGELSYSFLVRPEEGGADVVRIQYQLCNLGSGLRGSHVKIFDDSNGRNASFVVLRINGNCIGLSKKLLFSGPPAISEKQVIRFEFEDTKWNQTREFHIDLAEIDFSFKVSILDFPVPKAGDNSMRGVPVSALPKGRISGKVFFATGEMAMVKHVGVWILKKEEILNSNLRLLLGGRFYNINFDSASRTACGSEYIVGKVKNVEIDGISGLRNLQIRILDNKRSICREIHPAPIEIEIETSQEDLNEKEATTGSLNAVVI